MWDDVVIFDTKTLLECAKDQLSNALFHKQAGNAVEVSKYVTKTLNTIHDCEKDYPSETQAIRETV